MRGCEFSNRSFPQHASLAVSGTGVRSHRWAKEPPVQVPLHREAHPLFVAQRGAGTSTELAHGLCKAPPAPELGRSTWLTGVFIHFQVWRTPTSSN